SNALAYYTIVKNGVDTRLDSFYATTGRSGDLKLIEHSLQKNEFRGSISYTFVKTDNALYTDSQFKKVEIETSIESPVHMTQKYNIFNVKEIVQTQKQTTLGSKSIGVKLKGKRNTTLSEYLTKAKAI